MYLGKKKYLKVLRNVGLREEGKALYQIQKHICGVRKDGGQRTEEVVLNRLRHTVR